MPQPAAYLLLSLDEQRYALPIANVERVVRAVAVTPLPDAPATVSGVVNVAGRILPVIDLRKKFGLPAQPLSPESRFVIVATPQRLAVLTVDRAEEVIRIPAEALIAATAFLAAPGALRGLTVNSDEIILIEDPELLLTVTDGVEMTPAATAVPGGNGP